MKTYITLPSKKRGKETGRMEFSEYLGYTVPFANMTIGDLLFALVVGVTGLVAARIVLLFFQKTLRRSARLPELVVVFLVRFLSVFLYLIVVLLVLAALGVDISAVLVGLSAIIGLVLGFGLQDSFTNFAAGIWLAALRPIDTGEYVEINGMGGTVSAVGIMATELLQFDNTYILIPNALVWGSPVINYSRMELRRVDVPFGIAYRSRVDAALRVGMELMDSHPQVLADPAPVVVVTDLADSSVNLVLRAWTKTPDYWVVKNDLMRGILDNLQRAGIEIPFPQIDVHLDRQG
jgi:small conductance mechanosensitive channel